MFLENKYTKWYYKLVNQVKDRNQTSEAYYEIHHIIPRCIGGQNNKENLVRLTAREHFIAHCLLTKMLSGVAKRKMTFALFRMTSCNSNQQRYQINNRQYEIVKKQMAKEIKEQNKNQTYTQKQRDKMKKTLETNGGPWNKGKKMCDSFKQKIKQARLSRPQMSQITRAKISNTLKEYNKIYLTTYSQRQRPRMFFKLRNTKTGEETYTTNLTNWCKQHHMSTAAIYTRNSDWIILEKGSLKKINDQ